MTAHSTIIRQTQHWVQSVIVGLNFCPFAGHELERGSIHFQVSDSPDLATGLHDLIDECRRLDTHPGIETTLLIFAAGYHEFDEYLQLVELGDSLLTEQGYAGIYQLASFHPAYCFEGEQETDAANYTNRSPYAMLHLIREASIEQALAHCPDPEAIPVRNITLARTKGLQEMKDILARCMHPPQISDE